MLASGFMVPMAVFFTDKATLAASALEDLVPLIIGAVGSVFTAVEDPGHDENSDASSAQSAWFVEYRGVRLPGAPFAVGGSGALPPDCHNLTAGRDSWATRYRPDGSCMLAGAVCVVFDGKHD